MFSGLLLLTLKIVLIIIGFILFLFAVKYFLNSLLEKAGLKKVGVSDVIDLLIICELIRLWLIL